MRFALVLIAAVALAACNADEKGKDGLKTVDGPVDQEEAGGVIGSRVCDAYRECRCGELAGVSLDGCETGLGFSWVAREDEARERGLTYDGDCVAARVNAMAERGCDLPDQTTVPYCTGETCQVWYGTKGEGEECEGGQSTSDCQQGLVCLGTCQKPCANTGVDIAEGEVCRDEEIDFYGVCAEGLICDPMSGTCLAYPEAGEPCLQGAICAEGLWCDPNDGDPVCAERVPDGGDCTLPQQCESANCTAEQVCGPPPGEGEACTTTCADGLICTRNDANMLVCVRPPSIGEPCLDDPRARCAETLTCRDGTCVERPGDGESCAAGDDRIPLQCQEGLVCGAKLCRLTPTAPGCSECAPDDDTCTVLVCSEIPPAVCGDSGGLLY